jgi:hypothetical protein
MANTVHINRSGATVPVYQYQTGAKIGDIYNKELFVGFGDFNTVTRNQRVCFYSPSGWRNDGNITVDFSQGARITDAYHGDFSSGWSSVTARNSVSPMSGFVFPVRRQCRIWSGSSHYDTIYSGDAIMCADSYSTAGATYQYRLSIVGYRKAGVWTYVPYGGWSDTDIEIGYSMYSQVTPYSTKW